MRLLFFVLSALVSRAAAFTVAVAGCHSGRDKDHRPRANCTAAGYSDVPAGFDPTTRVLLFPNNLFSSLTWSSFQTFTEIYEIDLTGNKIPALTSSLSPVLPNLCVLRLGSNRLTTLSDFSFSACPGLAELYLYNNAIESLSDHTFSGLAKLEILDLSSNRIKVLPELMLHPLPAIETLYLEDNKIRVMPDNWFSQKEEVPYLYLSANPWACSCSLDYLRRYLDDNEANVYVRDGPNIKSDGESVVCDSPQVHKGTPVLTLEESDLCSSEPTETGPTGDSDQPLATTAYYLSYIVPATTTIPSPPPHTPPHTPPPPPPAAAHYPTSMTASPSSTPAFLTPFGTRVVTWSWYHSFTLMFSNSGSGWRTEAATHPSHPTVRPSTETPANPLTKPAEATKPATTTVTPTTATVQKMQTTATVPTTIKTHAVATTTTSTALSWVIDKQLGEAGAIRGVVVFCLWLFAGCLLLCVLSAVCTAMTMMKLVVWYRRVYRPLSTRLARRPQGDEGVRLMAYDGTEAKGAAAGEPVELYRSVLFIHREGGGATETGNAGQEVTGGKGEATRERF